MKPITIAHRGAPRLAPENTLASFEKAFSFQHVDAVELDVHLTKDGRAAVIHDDTLDRTTKAKGFVSERNAAELAALGVPLLDEVLELARAREKRVFVELKMQPRFYAGLPDVVVRAVRAARMEERVVAISFDHRALVALKKAAPEVACGALLAQRVPTPGRYVREFLGCEWWLPGAIGEYDTLGFFSATRELDREGVEDAHRAGVKIAPWTINHKEQARALVALGADGIISDDPALLGNLQ